MLEKNDPFEMVPFRGTFVHFGGGGPSFHLQKLQAQPPAHRSAMALLGDLFRLHRSITPAGLVLSPSTKIKHFRKKNARILKLFLPDICW